MKFLPKLLFIVAVAGFLFATLIDVATDWAVDIRPVMKIVVTLLIGGAAVFVILSKRYGPKDKHWAYATAGTILGYWLKM